MVSLPLSYKPSSALQGTKDWGSPKYSWLEESVSIGGNSQDLAFGGSRGFPLADREKTQRAQVPWPILLQAKGLVLAKGSRNTVYLSSTAPVCQSTHFGHPLRLTVCLQVHLGTWWRSRNSWRGKAAPESHLTPSRLKSCFSRQRLQGALPRVLY